MSIYSSSDLMLSYVFDSTAIPTTSLPGVGGQLINDNFRMLRSQFSNSSTWDNNASRNVFPAYRAVNASSANYAYSAEYASRAGYASSAGCASTASYTSSANYANYATLASYAGYANPSNGWSLGFYNSWGTQTSVPMGFFGEARSFSTQSSSTPTASQAPMAAAVSSFGPFSIDVNCVAYLGGKSYHAKVMLCGNNLVLASADVLASRIINHSTSTVEAGSVSATVVKSADFANTATNGFLFTIYNNVLRYKFALSGTTSQTWCYGYVSAITTYPGSINPA